MKTKPIFSADEYFYLLALINDDLKGNERYTTNEYGWRHDLKTKIRQHSEMKKND